MRFGLRSVAAGAVAILAVAVMVVSLGFDAAELWASRNPVRAVEVNADGAATLRGVTVTFTGVEEVDSLEDPYGPSFTAPQGSKLWLASFEAPVPTA